MPNLCECVSRCVSFAPFKTILEIVFVYVICDGYLQKDFSFCLCRWRAEQQGRQSCFLFFFYNEKEAKESGKKSDEQNNGW